MLFSSSVYLYLKCIIYLFIGTACLQIWSVSSMRSRILSVLFTPFSPVPRITQDIVGAQKAFVEFDSPVNCNRVEGAKWRGLVFTVFHQILSICSSPYAQSILSLFSSRKCWNVCNMKLFSFSMDVSQVIFKNLILVYNTNLFVK